MTRLDQGRQRLSGPVAGGLGRAPQPCGFAPQFASKAATAQDPPPRGGLRRAIVAELEAAPAGLSCDELALRLRRRRADVLGTLRADPFFWREGRTRGSRWRLSPRKPRAHGTELDGLPASAATPRSSAARALVETPPGSGACGGSHGLV
jgi:hypothetical protein